MYFIAWREIICNPKYLKKMIQNKTNLLCGARSADNYHSEAALTTFSSTSHGFLINCFYNSSSLGVSHVSPLITMFMLYVVT